MQNERNILKSILLQPVDLADPDQSRRVRFFVGARAIAVRGTRRGQEGGPSQV